MGRGSGRVREKGEEGEGGRKVEEGEKREKEGGRWRRGRRGRGRVEGGGEKNILFLFLKSTSYFVTHFTLELLNGFDAPG